MPGFHVALALIVGTLTVMLVGLASIDAVYAYRGLPSLGDRVHDWTGRYPWLAAALIAVYGAVLAHLVFNVGDL